MKQKLFVVDLTPKSLENMVVDILISQKVDIHSSKVRLSFMTQIDL